MKKNYADYNKLNRLLVASFEAEKLYYNAAQDAPNTELKRFLNYMAVERNRMSHDISNELHSRDIEPLKEDAEKGNLNRSWQEIKEALETFDAESILNSCIARDNYNIKRYDDILAENDLPAEIITMLEKHRKELDWYTKQAEQHKSDPFKKVPATRDEALGKVQPTTDQKKGEKSSNSDGKSKVLPINIVISKAQN